MPSPNTITVPQLSRLIGTPEAPVLIDLCIDEDFALDPRFIPTSFRHPFKKIEDLAAELADQKAVVICQKGKKISQGAAALLRNAGVQAEVLEGGVLAWRDAGEMLIPAATIPVKDASGATLWVTKQRPKIDRIACAWLIRRFVDSSAKFLFVGANEVLDVAEKFGATSFDVEGAVYTHKGDLCSFDALIEAFELKSKALADLAEIVRAADTDKLDSSQQAAGLMAVSLGLSRMYKDDLAQLEAGFTIYDALYRWARDAQGEAHVWDLSNGK